MPRVKKYNNPKAAFVDEQNRKNSRFFPAAGANQLNTSTNSSTSNSSLQSITKQKLQKNDKKSYEQKKLDAQIRMSEVAKAKRALDEEWLKKSQKEITDKATNLSPNLKQEQDNNTKQEKPSFWARMPANIADMFAAVWSSLIVFGISIVNMFHKGSIEKTQNNSHTNNNEKILINNKKHVNTWSEYFNSMFFCFGATNAQNTNDEQDKKLGNDKNTVKSKRIKIKSPNRNR